jgi:hypothetical protein
VVAAGPEAAFISTFLSCRGLGRDGAQHPVDDAGRSESTKRWQ